MFKNILKIVALVSVVSAPLSAYIPRTTYFKFLVNGAEDTVMTQGTDAMGWECNCGLGDTLVAELWLDLNGNHTIDAADRLWFMGEGIGMIDGDTIGDRGPADSSAVLDGIFYCALPPNFAFAPTYYVMKVTNTKDSSTAEDWIRIKPNPSPAVTVSGTVSIEGVTPPNSLLNAIYVSTSMDNDPAWWGAITDSSGHYTLNLSGTGTWHIAPIDNIPPYIAPSETTINVSGNTSGVNFEYTQPEAFVYGDVKDDRDSLILQSFQIYLVQGENNVGQTNSVNGHYSIGASVGDNYKLEMWSEQIFPDYLMPDLWNQPFSLAVDDSLRKDIILTIPDTFIFGIITENGSVPSQAYSMGASSDSIGRMEVYSNPATGAFTLPVKQEFTYGIQLNIGDTPLPEGFGFESGNNWNAEPGDTVYVKLVSYKGSVSGDFTVDAGDPMPDFEQFNIRVVDENWNTKGESRVDSTGHYKVYAPEGTWKVSPGGPEEWLTYPASIDSVQVDTVDVPGNDFMINYGHCTVAGTLHGLFDVPKYTQIYASTDSGQGYSKRANFNDDSSCSFKLCEGEWTVQAPNITCYEIAQNETTFTVTDSDSLKTVDFYYTPVLYLTWTGDNGFENDGVDPDTGLNGTTFEFRVRYVCKTLPSLPVYHEVWVDLNDNSEYDSTERFTMEEVDTSDNTYNDGKDYSLSLPLTYAGGEKSTETIHYQFYFTYYGMGTATLVGEPTEDHPVVLTSVGIAENKIPLITSLNSIRPNPFTREAVINYSCSSPVKVSLKIYDLTGRIVKTLVQEEQKTGYYTVNWNGKDDANKKLSAGVYFCKFSAGNVNSTRKLILVR